MGLKIDVGKCIVLVVKKYQRRSCERARVSREEKEEMNNLNI